MKSAKLEWALDQLPAALNLLEDGIKAFPDFAKLWMMRGQILEGLGRDAEAKEVYGQGVSSGSGPRGARRCGCRHGGCK